MYSVKIKKPCLFYCHNCKYQWISTTFSRCHNCNSGNMSIVPIFVLHKISEESYIKYGIREYIKYDKEHGEVIL